MPLHDYEHWNHADAPCEPLDDDDADYRDDADPFENATGEGDDDGCQGHPAGPCDPMGETIYCDGSCV